ncbi:hypothetical protein JL722_11073 [Aureococcus anophagefferens]|nr:hypothetical protein JL722_11073 [Aureococcus anophagefferens]
MGSCDRESGLCECRSGFAGEACQRMRCPHGARLAGGAPLECFGVGTCLSMAEAAAQVDYVSLEHDAAYDGWDASMIYGCACDAGFAGYDCSERECPRGDDPLTAGVDEVQLLTCDCGEPGGCGNGTIALAFRGQRTAPIPADATAELLEFHLERLSTLGDVDVAYYGGGLDGSLCSDAGTTGGDHRRRRLRRMFCNCTAGYEGSACEYKTCPTGRAWWGEAVGDDPGDAHRPGATCSNKGLCDRSSGNCDCDDDFGVVGGDACGDMACEVNSTRECGAFGHCATMAELAQNALLFGDHGEVRRVNYSEPWDADLVTGCKCHASTSDYPTHDFGADPVNQLQYRGPFAYTYTGWTGYQCSHAFCPTGDNPYTWGVNEVQALNCSSRPTAPSTSRSAARPPVRVPWWASAAELEARLEALPTIRDAAASLRNVSYNASVCGPGQRVYVEFLSEHGDLPLLVVSEADDLRHDVVVNVTEVTKGTKEDVECSANGICNREIGICACLDGFASGADDGEPLGAYGQRGDCGFRHTGTKNEKWENSEMQYLRTNQIFNATLMQYDYIFEVTASGTTGDGRAASPGMAEDLTQRFRGLVRGCPRSGAAAPPPPPPPPPSAQLRRAALVVRGIRRCERTLRRVAVAYATPGPAGGLATTSDGVDARVAAVLAECRAALAAAPRGAAAAPREARAPRTTAAAPRSRARRPPRRRRPTRRLARAVELSALFRDLQRLRCRRELGGRRRLAFPPAPADWPPDCARRGSAATDGEARTLDAAWTRAREAAEAADAAAAAPAAAAPARGPRPQLPRRRARRAGAGRGGARRRRRGAPARRQLQLERERLATEFEARRRARRAEAKMEHVSRLTSAFSSLVSEQAETVANLYDLVEETAASVDNWRCAARARFFVVPRLPPRRAPGLLLNAP